MQEPYKSIYQADIQLVARCLANEHRAQKELYDRYQKAMFTLAYRISNSFEDAEEILQDAFISAFRGLVNFKHESTLGAWIKTITVRTALKKTKHKWQAESIEDYQAEQDYINWGTEPVDPEYLEDIIQGLPPGYRSIFVLIEVEGYSHKEVSEMLNISIGTTKSQLFHAKKLLQKKLEQFK